MDYQTIFVLCSAEFHIFGSYINGIYTVVSRTCIQLLIIAGVIRHQFKAGIILEWIEELEYRTDAIRSYVSE